MKDLMGEMKWARQDSNLRPSGYEPPALPLSYEPPEKSLKSLASQPSSGTSLPLPVSPQC